MNEWISLVVTHSSYLLFLGKKSLFKNTTENSLEEIGFNSSFSPVVTAGCYSGMRTFLGYKILFL